MPGKGAFVETSARVGPVPGALVAQQGNDRRHSAASSEDGVDPAENGTARSLEGPRLDLPDESLLTIPALLLEVASKRGEQVGLRFKSQGIYRELTWAQLLQRICRIGLGLRALGVRPGDRVAIVGDPSPIG